MRRLSSLVAALALVSALPSITLAAPPAPAVDDLQTIVWTATTASGDLCSSTVDVTYTVGKGAPRQLVLLSWHNGQNSWYTTTVKAPRAGAYQFTLPAHDFNGDLALVRIVLQTAKGTWGEIGQTAFYDFPDTGCPAAGTVLGSYGL